MLLVVRTRDQLKKSCDALAQHVDRSRILGVPISRTTPQKLIVPDEAEGIIVTSPNALISIPQGRLPLFCVGPETAEEAARLGHRVLVTGDGDGADMMRQIIQRYPAQKLVHACGDRAGDGWYAIGEKVGFTLMREEVYTTENLPELDDDVQNALREGRVQCALLFSAAGAAHFCHLVSTLEIAHSTLNLLAFSAQVAQATTGCGTCHVAARPTMAAMCEKLQEEGYI